MEYTGQIEQGQQISVTYSLTRKLNPDEARELIRSNTPDGFTVQNVHVELKQ